MLGSTHMHDDGLENAFKKHISVSNFQIIVVVSSDWNWYWGSNRWFESDVLDSDLNKNVKHFYIWSETWVILGCGFDFGDYWVSSF